MWRKQMIGDQVFVVYESGVESIGIVDEPSDHPIYKRYEAWLAEGNEPEEWKPE